VDFLAIASGAAQHAAKLTADAEGEALFQVNLFQVIIASANFVIFLALLWTFALKPVAKILNDRKARIDEGLRDAEQARKDRESAETERVAALQEARREANDILTRAQKLAEESRERDLAATREELERVRARATADIEAQKQRAIADVRAEVADLALRAAGKVVGETMNDDRQRRLVDEFLQESASANSGSRGGRTG
jgi:F-type H+-transporting ATPase subunit b